MSLETLAPPTTTADELVDHVAMRFESLPNTMPDYTVPLQLRVNDEYDVWLLDDTRRPLTLLDGTTTEYGSFKWRGAHMKLQALLAEDPGLRKTHTGSAGNAALGVTGSVLEHNREQPKNKPPVTAHVYVPEYTSPIKTNKLRRAGAIVHDEFLNLADCLEAAHHAAEEDHSALIPPFDDIDVIAGQGTAAFAIARLINRQRASGEWTVYEPLGGGSRSSGVAAGLHILKKEDALAANVSLHVVSLEDRLNQLWSAGTATEMGKHPESLLNDKRFVTRHLTVPPNLGKQSVVGLREATNRIYEGAGGVALSGALQDILAGKATPNSVVSLTGTGSTEQEYQAIARSVLGCTALGLSVEVVGSASHSKISSHRAPV